MTYRTDGQWGLTTSANEHNMPYLVSVRLQHSVLRRWHCRRPSLTKDIRRQQVVGLQRNCFERPYPVLKNLCPRGSGNTMLFLETILRLSGRWYRRQVIARH